MIVLDIAEWIANILIFGIAAIIWVVVVFGFMMIITILQKQIRDFKND